MRKYVILSALILICGHAGAEVFKVSSSEAFRKIEPTLHCSDTVMWAEGVYDGVTIRLNASGRKGSPVVLMAQKPGRTVFTGSTKVYLQGDWEVLEGFRFEDLERKGPSFVGTGPQSHNCTVTDCWFSEEHSRKISGKSSFSLSIAGYGHTVSHCTFKDKKSTGVQLYVKVDTVAPPRTVIENNLFERPTSLTDKGKGPCNGQECMRIGYSGTSMEDGECIVRGNHFNRYRGELNEVISNKSCRNTYTSNLFSQCQGTLTIRHGSDCTVEGNIFVGGGAEGCGGVRLIGPGHSAENNIFVGLDGKEHRASLNVMKGIENGPIHMYWPSVGVRVKGNTFIGCRQALLLGYSGWGEFEYKDPERLVVKGNRIICNSDEEISVDCRMDPGHIKANGNAIYGGTMKGCSWRTSGKRPSVPEWKQKADGIALNAGVRWDYPSTTITVGGDLREMINRDDLHPGDTVIIRDGEYRNVRIDILSQGTREHPIVLRAQTPGKAVLSGTSRLSLAGSFIIAEGLHFKDIDSEGGYNLIQFRPTSHDCILRNCMVDGTGCTESLRIGYWVSLDGERNEVSGCSFRDKRSMGVIIGVRTASATLKPSHRIINNRFERPYSLCDERGGERNGQEIIRIGNSSQQHMDFGCLVEGNHFLHCNGECEIISCKSSCNTMENNLFEQCKGCLCLRHGNFNTVRCNYFDGGALRHTGGVRIIGEGHKVEKNVLMNLYGADTRAPLAVMDGESHGPQDGYAHVRNVIISDNVFLSCRGAIDFRYRYIQSQDLPAENLTFCGNVIVAHPKADKVFADEDIPARDFHSKANRVYVKDGEGAIRHYAGTEVLPREQAQLSAEDFAAAMQAIRDGAGASFPY